MKDIDFFLALEGIDVALKKLDKLMLLELKHLHRPTHISIFMELMKLSFRL